MNIGDTAVTCCEFAGAIYILVLAAQAIPRHRHEWGKWAEVRGLQQKRACETCGRSQRRWA